MKPPASEPESLGFLLVQVCHLHHHRAHELFEAIGLYRGQPPVLSALWEQEGLTHTGLARRLRVTPATITRMLQRMQKAGFVVCKPDAEDQRVSRVYLTAAGRAIQAQVDRAISRMDEETFAGLTAEEAALLHGFLFRIRENLSRAQGAQSPACQDPQRSGEVNR